MLTQAALDFYFVNSAKAQFQTLEAISNAIKNNFEGPEYRHTLLGRWNTFTFETVRKENKSKTLGECLILFT